MVRLLFLVLALVSATGCSYIQMQPKSGDRPPAPAPPRLP
jgi:hypothetical protein